MENYKIYNLSKNLAKAKIRKCERCTDGDVVMELNGIWLCSTCGLKEIRHLLDEEIIAVNGIEREEEKMEKICMEDEL